jgi:hypothetical protein
MARSDLYSFFHKKYNKNPISHIRDMRLFPYYTYIIEVNDTLDKEDVYMLFSNYSGCFIDICYKTTNNINKKNNAFFEIYVYKGEHIIVETLLKHLVSVNNIYVLKKIKFVIMFHTNIGNSVSKRIHSIYNTYYPSFQFTHTNIKS